MLRSGYNYIEGINNLIARNISNPRYRYVFYGHAGRMIHNSADYFDDHRIFISTVQDPEDPECFIIVGFVNYFIDVDDGLVDDVMLVNFLPEYMMTFANDMLKSLDIMFMDEEVHRIGFGACGANTHALECYRKLCKRLGGRRTGIEHDSMRIYGKYHDLWNFEILRKGYVKHRPKRFTRERKKKNDVNGNNVSGEHASGYPVPNGGDA